MTDSNLHVVVDEREYRAGLPSMFEDHDDVRQVDTELLDVGDIVAGGDVVFERKSVGDFVGSIKNRRLESQIDRMYEMFEPERSYVIIEGDMSDFWSLEYSQFSPQSACGYVGSLSARWQCVPLFASNRTNLVDMVTRITRKHKETTKRVVRDPESSPSRAQNDFFSRTVLQLSGVGKSKIEPLRDKYGTVRSLSEATESELTSIDGIGPKTADSIIEQFGGKDD